MVWSDTNINAPTQYLRNTVGEVKNLNDSIKAPLQSAANFTYDTVENAGFVSTSSMLGTQLPVSYGTTAPIVGGIRNLLTVQVSNALTELVLTFPEGPENLLVSNQTENGLQDLLTFTDEEKSQAINVQQTLERLQHLRQATNDEGKILVLEKMIEFLKSRIASQSSSNRGPTNSNTNSTNTTPSPTQDNSSETATITKEEFRNQFESYLKDTPYWDNYNKAKNELNPTLSLGNFSRYANERLGEQYDMIAKAEKGKIDYFTKSLDNAINAGRQA